MTPQEALEALKIEQIQIEGKAIRVAKFFEGISVANKALEKQIPKKPTPHKVDVEKIKIGNGYWGKGTTIYKCPNCKDFISRTYTYCHKCGQALDWGGCE